MNDWADNLDFEDPDDEAGEADVTDDEEQQEQQQGRGGGRRGPDIDWREVARYGNRQEYLASQFPEELEKYNQKKAWTTKYAENEVWGCKFGLKAGYHKCQRLVKLEYLNSSMAVVVLDNTEAHRHEADPNYMTAGKKYLWTPGQEEIILPLARNKMSPTVIMRELRRKEASNGRGIYPTISQINSKKKYMYQKLCLEEMVMLDTADLRNYIEERSVLPEDPHQCFIVDSTIDDSDVTTGKPRFTVTFSTRSLVKRISKHFIQDDATYKMNWQKYPVLTHGVSTDTGRFFLTHVTLSSHEDTKAWNTNFSFIKNQIGGAPKFCMADGAWEITNAAKDVFGGLSTRLMCWSHTYRNVRPKLATIRKENKELGESILSDIESIQWMCQTADEFRALTKLLKEHYCSLDTLSAHELSLVKTFFVYFLSQWGPGSHVQNWYAGAHPFAIGNNQGLEGTHKQYKKDHTFRSEVPLPEFIQITENLVRFHKYK